MQSRLVRLLAAVLALTLLATACGDDDDDTTEGDDTAEDDTAAEDDSAEGDDAAAEEDMAELGTIVDVAAEAGSFTTLVAAIEAAGLVETLSGEGPFTVFAPTDDAFADAIDALGTTAEELLAREDLAAILTYHVVAGEVPAADVVALDGQSVATVNGAEVSISVDGETVMVNEATVITTDIETSNGIIHVIDSVLLPPA